MTRWQYITDKLLPAGFFGGSIDREKLEGLLQERSAEGWELVSVVPMIGIYGITKSVLLIFKRPI